MVLISTVCDRSSSLLPYWAASAITSQFGNCDSGDDGLYDLQTFYVQHVINVVAPDDPSKAYYVLASNCCTSHTTTERRELATFVDHVTRAGAAVDPGWRQRVLTYATALQSTLGR